MYTKQERMMQMTFTKLPKAITAEELLSTPLPPVKWIRLVYLSKEMCQLLKAWRKECEWDRQQTTNETVSEDDYLFRQPNGKPINPCTFTYRFKLILKANNLPLDLNVHSLRHTNASLLISQGVDVRTVASLLGHAQASTTLDIYAHAFDKNKRKAQEKLGKAIGL